MILPPKTLAYRTRLIEAIRDNHTAGASELARQALDGIQAYASELCGLSSDGTPPVEEMSAALLQMARDLQQQRPSMAPIQNLVQQWIVQFSRATPSSPKAVEVSARQISRQLSEQSLQALSQIASYALKLIGEGATIMTHSSSSSVFRCFELLSHKKVKAIVTESRPGREGHRLARALADLGISSHYITDAQMGLFIGQANLVLVGADTLLADGSLVNKSGTYLLALAARDHNIPFYTCCERLKYSPLLPESVELESKSATEIAPPVSPLITPHNIYFDVTPAELISGYITESGVSTTLPAPGAAGN